METCIHVLSMLPRLSGLSLDFAAMPQRQYTQLSALSHLTCLQVGPSDFMQLGSQEMLMCKLPIQQMDPATLAAFWQQRLTPTRWAASLGKQYLNTCSFLPSPICLPSGRSLPGVQLKEFLRTPACTLLSRWTLPVRKGLLKSSALCKV